MVNNWSGDGFVRVEGSGNGKVALRRLKRRNPGDTSPQCRFCGENTLHDDRGWYRKPRVITLELYDVFAIKCPSSPGICGGW